MADFDPLPSKKPPVIYDPARTPIPFTLGTLQGSLSMGSVKMDASEIVEEHLFLAERIAFDYANIPGCRLDEARLETTMGLIRAANA